MIFKLGKTIIKFGILFIIIFLISVSIRGNHFKKMTETHSGFIVKTEIDSTHTGRASLKSITDNQNLSDFEGGERKDYHSTLNSVNVIINLIYRVTNKSLK